MIAAAEKHIGLFGEGLLILFFYALFFRRLLKSKPENRVEECGYLTLILFTAIVPISNPRNVPEWLFGGWIILLVLHCFATLFFALQRMMPSFAHDARTSGRVPREKPTLNVSKKTVRLWNFDPDHLTWPYVLIIPGVFVISSVVGIIAGDFVRWGGLVLFTTFIFGFFINDSRRYFHERRFWMLTACLAGLHIGAFLAILLRIANWRLLWFSVMILEVPPFVLLRNLLLRDITSESPSPLP